MAMVELIISSCGPSSVQVIISNGLRADKITVRKRTMANEHGDFQNASLPSGVSPEPSAHAGLPTVIIEDYQSALIQSTESDRQRPQDHGIQMRVPDDEPSDATLVNDTGRVGSSATQKTLTHSTFAISTHGGQALNMRAQERFDSDRDMETFSSLKTPQVFNRRSMSDSHVAQTMEDIEDLNLDGAFASSTPHQRTVCGSTQAGSMSMNKLQRGRRLSQFSRSLHHLNNLEVSTNSQQPLKSQEVPTPWHQLNSVRTRTHDEILPQMSLTSMMTRIASVFDTARSSLLTGQVFSPRSRRAIVKSAKTANGSQGEPVCFGGYLASCTPSCSILELRQAEWKIPIQNQKFDGLEVGDRLLVEFRGGLTFEGGDGFDILESIVLVQSNDKSVVVIGHERVPFSLVGGSMAVKLFLVKRTFFERKFHAVSTTGQSGLAGLRIACTMKMIQGPPLSAKMPHIMKEIESTVPRRSRVLIVGENVRERMELSPNFTLLNLGNLRHNSKVTEEMRDAGHRETETLLRQQHFELLQQTEEFIVALTGYCDEYANVIKHQGSKAAKNQQMQKLLSSFEAVKDHLEEADKRLAAEVYPDVQFIYGTVDDLRNCLALVSNLEPAASIILEADSLSLKELGVVFSLRPNNIYLSIDTPFLWHRVRQWKVKHEGGLFGRRPHISEEFLTRIEQFIDPQMMSVEFFHGWLPDADPSFGQLFSCFKHTFAPSTQKYPLSSVMVIKHVEKGDTAVKFEADLLKSMGNLFAMAGEHDHNLYAVSEDGKAMELCDNLLVVESTRLGDPLRHFKRSFKAHADSFVSLHGLTAAALPFLYELICSTKRKVILVGNLNQLKQADEHVRRFVNNLQACGFVRKSIILTCPKHKSDVILGSSFAEKSATSWQTGCNERCVAILPCGHQCNKTCHFHDEQTFDDEPPPCYQRCGKELPCGHHCPYRCGQPCLTRCPGSTDVVARCGHTTPVPCSRWVDEQQVVVQHCSKPKCQRNFSDPCSMSRQAASRSKSKMQRRSNFLARILGTT